MARTPPAKYAADIALADVAFRPLVDADEDFFLTLTTLARWGTARGDFKRSRTIEPHGGIVAYLTTPRKHPVGLVHTYTYGGIGWIGNVLVLPCFRNQGLGRALMSQAQALLASRGVAVTALEAVERAVPLYRRVGFTANYQTLRYARDLHKKGEPSPMDEDLVAQMRDSDLPDVAAFDLHHSGLARERVLRYAWTDTPSLCLVARRGGVVIGYVMAHYARAADTLPAMSRVARVLPRSVPPEVVEDQRAFFRASVRRLDRLATHRVRVGPWVCDPDRADVAAALLDAVVAQSQRILNNAPLTLRRRTVGDVRRCTVTIAGVPEMNQWALRLLEHNGFEQTRVGVRMTQGAGGCDFERVRSILSIGSADKG
jgi:ribosomal protein S18 acetylase RimI-like enzyme